jgi:hypothetical protein
MFVTASPGNRWIPGRMGNSMLKKPSDPLKNRPVKHNAAENTALNARKKL